MAEIPKCVDSLQEVAEVSAGLLQGRRQQVNWEVEAKSVLLL